MNYIKSAINGNGRIFVGCLTLKVSGFMLGSLAQYKKRETYLRNTKRENWSIRAMPPDKMCTARGNNLTSLIPGKKGEERRGKKVQLLRQKSGEESRTGKR